MYSITMNVGAQHFEPIGNAIGMRELSGVREMRGKVI
jgi:hypothetical protein